MDIQWTKIDDVIVFSPNTVKALSLNMSKVFLKIGQWEKELTVCIEESFSNEAIGLPSWINNIFNLPTTINYEVKVTGGTILLGPVIAMIASEKLMHPNRLNKFLSRFKDYQTINGLIYIFSPSRVNLEHQTIKGFYYNPERNNGTFWEEGVFPYPGVLYKRIPIKKRIYHHLKNVVGEAQIFNSYHFTKWELWERLPEQSESKRLLPYTEKLSNYEQMLTFTEQFGTAYLKPQSGSGGIGIKTIQKNEEGYTFINHFNDVETFRELPDIWGKIKAFTTKGYLIQQGIDAGFKDQHVDFRAYMQKNYNKDWCCQLMITRFSKKNEISTNLKYLDRLCMAKEGICKLFSVDESEALEIERTMQEACIRLCKDLDAHVGHYGDLAIDLMVDRHKNIWIIEVNTKTYGYSSFKKLKNTTLFYRCKTTPFQYAKALAGF